MKDLFLMIPLGLGDCLVCNGLIRSLSYQYEKTYVPCFTHNMSSVQFMFSDIPSIIVQPVGTPNEIFIMQVQHEANGTKVLKLGTYSGESHKEPESFDMTLYRQANVPFSKRWDSFELPEVKQILHGDILEKCAFVADDDSRGFNIEHSKVGLDKTLFRPWKAHTIFEFVPILSNAPEIHCINSAFAILADSIPTKGKLFLHRYARPYTPYDNFKVRKKWEILN